MRRDAEKKDLVGPRQRRGLAEGIKPQAKDGGNLRLFFRRWDPPLKPVFYLWLNRCLVNGGQLSVVALYKLKHNRGFDRVALGVKRKVSCNVFALN